jgi:methionyl-tRNA formyltransferase
MKNRTIFLGTPDFAIPSLEALIHADYEIVSVITQPDRESGRGKLVNSSPVKKFAIVKGLDVFQPETLKDKKVLDYVSKLKPQLIIVAAYGLLITPEILAVPEFGCLNVHPSLLPKYRGSSPVATVILNGDEVTGVTIMLMDKGLDTGPVLRQIEAPIAKEDTTGSLTTGLARVGAQLLVKTIPRWVEGNIKPLSQDEAKAIYTRSIIKEDGKISWNATALELWRRVRAFDPWPGCYTSWQGKRLKINKAIPIEGETSEQAGKVVVLPGSNTAVGIITRDGILGLLEVQLEGKKSMTAEEFIRGHREFPGTVLV